MTCCKLTGWTISIGLLKGLRMHYLHQNLTIEKESAMESEGKSIADQEMVHLKILSWVKTWLSETPRWEQQRGRGEVMQMQLGSRTLFARMRALYSVFGTGQNKEVRIRHIFKKNLIWLYCGEWIRR